MASIKTTYLPDGSVKREPTGYGGDLCKTALAPYLKRQAGGWTSTPTDEAQLPEAQQQLPEQHEQRA